LSVVVPNTKESIDTISQSLYNEDELKSYTDSNASHTILQNYS